MKDLTGAYVRTAMAHRILDAVEPGNFVLSETVPWDSTARINVLCIKHRQLIPIEFLDAESFKDAVYAAAHACKDCIAENVARIPTTRFPEGAEL